MTLASRVAELTWVELVEGGASLDALRKALQGYGGLLLRDCPAQQLTPPSIFYDVVAQLFRLPRDVLLTYPATDGKNGRGYLPPDEHRGWTLPAVWHVGSESDAPDGREGPRNFWPREVPGLRTILVPYYAQLVAVADAVFAAIAGSYCRPADYFAALRPGGDDVLRLLHYKPEPSRLAPGFVAHSDVGLLTIYLPATHAGLEIELEPGVWVAMDVPADGLLIGVGGALSLMTDREFPTLRHRAIGLTEAGIDERFAGVFFANPYPDAALTGLREPSRKVLGSYASFEEYFQGEVRQAYERDNKWRAEREGR
jgi:isopenicillin N synthase-like dioxygenase